MRRRISRIVAVTATAIGALVVAIIVAGLPLYVFPPAGSLGHADLIYVLGPATRERLAVERELRADGVADMSLISVLPSGLGSAADLAACREPQVYCNAPEPFTTKGEIAYLQKFAAERGVTRTIILTWTPHVSRVRFIVDKCYRGDATVVAVDQHLDLAQWASQYIYQSAAFVKAWLTPCADPSDL